MIVKLVRHSFPDDPNWIIVNPKVPIGTKYRVIKHYPTGAVLVSKETGMERAVEVYLLEGNNDTGYLPCICFEEVLD